MTLFVSFLGDGVIDAGRHMHRSRKEASERLSGMYSCFGAISVALLGIGGLVHVGEHLRIRWYCLRA